MRSIATETVTIKKTDIEYLRAYTDRVDSTIQTLCATILNLNKWNPDKDDDTLIKKLTGLTSLSSTEIKHSVLKILSDAK